MQYIYTKLSVVIWVEVIIPVLAGHHFMHYNVILILQVISACFFSPLSSCETCYNWIFMPFPAFHPSKVRDYWTYAPFPISRYLCKVKDSINRKYNLYFLINTVSLLSFVTSFVTVSVVQNLISGHAFWFLFSVLNLFLISWMLVFAWGLF